MSLIHAFHGTPSGWADERLHEAYDLIWEVQQDNKDLRITECDDILKDIERVDTIISEERRPA